MSIGEGIVETRRWVSGLWNCDAVLFTGQSLRRRCGPDTEIDADNDQLLFAQYGRGGYIHCSLLYVGAFYERLHLPNFIPFRSVHVSHRSICQKWVPRHYLICKLLFSNIRLPPHQQLAISNNLVIERESILITQKKTSNKTSIYVQCSHLFVFISDWKNNQFRSCSFGTAQIITLLLVAFSPSCFYSDLLDGVCPHVDGNFVRPIRRHSISFVRRLAYNKGADIIHHRCHLVSFDNCCPTAYCLFEAVHRSGKSFPAKCDEEWRRECPQKSTLQFPSIPSSPESIKWLKQTKALYYKIT